MSRSEKDQLLKDDPLAALRFPDDAEEQDLSRETKLSLKYKLAFALPHLPLAAMVRFVWLVNRSFSHLLIKNICTRIYQLIFTL